MSVCFGGSRSLSSAFSPLVRSVVIALGASGVSVGCAAGADAFVIDAALAAGLPLAVYAVGASDGSGFWGGSAPWWLLSFAGAAPGPSVSWLAGGPLSIPLRARLLRRSVAALTGASSLVLFLASPGSPGSLAVAGEAVRRGLWVWAVACGFSGAPAAPRGCAGRWVSCELVGVPVWRWVPAGEQLPLL